MCRRTSKRNSRRSNVLSSIIKSGAADNMEFLSSTLLSGSDVAKLFGEQRKFESNWNGVKKLIGNAYLSNKEKAREIPAIDTMIADMAREGGRSVLESSLNNTLLCRQTERRTADRQRGQCA
jgi:hypothetical protein